MEDKVFDSLIESLEEAIDIANGDAKALRVFVHDDESQGVEYDDDPFGFGEEEEGDMVLVEDFLPSPDQFVLRESGDSRHNSIMNIVQKLNKDKCEHEGSGVIRLPTEWTERDYDIASKQVEELMDAEIDSAEESMLDVLAALVVEYEDEKHLATNEDGLDPPRRDGETAAYEDGPVDHDQCKRVDDFLPSPDQFILRESEKSLTNG